MSDFNPEFDYRVGNLRACRFPTCCGRGMEIRQCGDSSQWVIAYFVGEPDGSNGSERWELKFVDDRPFDKAVNPSEFMSLAKDCAAFLKFVRVKEQ